MKSAVGLLVLPCLLASFSALSAPRQYASALVGDDHRLVLTTVEGALEVPTLDRSDESEEDDQSGFEQPLISTDHATVGWLGLYPNCCTSYPLPLELVLYREGKVIARFRGEGTPIWRWAFESAGSRVAYCQRPAHFSSSTHFELRGASGELLEKLDREDEGDPRALPLWASELQCP